MRISPAMSGKQAYDASRFAMESEKLARESLSNDAVKLREVSKEFESLFVKIMLDSMRATLTDDTLIPKNSGEKLFEDMLYDDYARKISSRADLGIAEMIYDQLEAALPGSALDIST